MINPDYLKSMRPSDRALENCYLVTVPEPAFLIRYMKTWCFDNKLSLVWSELIDTSDVDYHYDNIAGFYFIDARDATMFTLKFKR